MITFKKFVKLQEELWSSNGKSPKLYDLTRKPLNPFTFNKRYGGSGTGGSAINIGGTPTNIGGGSGTAIK